MTDKHVYPSASFGTGNDDKLCSFNEIKGLTKQELFTLHIYCTMERQSTQGAVYWADELLREHKTMNKDTSTQETVSAIDTT